MLGECDQYLILSLKEKNKSKVVCGFFKSIYFGSASIPTLRPTPMTFY